MISGILGIEEIQILSSESVPRPGRKDERDYKIIPGITQIEGICIPSSESVESA